MASFFMRHSSEKPLKNIRHTINLVRIADKITHRFYRIRRIGWTGGKIHLRQNRQIAG